MADSIEDAVSQALEEAPGREFTETVDLAVNLRDLDLNDPSNRVDEEIVLPAGTGQETSIVVIAEGETALRAEDVADEVLSGGDLADLAGDEDEAKSLVFVAEEALMQDVASNLGRILGPRGKMPTPLGVDEDVVETVNRMTNTVQLRSGDRRTFHTRVGAEDMTADEVGENIDVIMRRLEADLEEKGPLNIDTVYVKTTMGPAVEVPA